MPVCEIRRQRDIFGLRHVEISKLEFLPLIFRKFQQVYRGADKSLAQPTSLSIVLSVQGKDGSPTGPLSSGFSSAR
jgi:hypothetical protein